jgi:cytokinin dehydrogenase
MLIMAGNTFDYIEGFVIINRTGVLNNWRTSFKPHGPVQASLFQSSGRVLYCLELTKNFNTDETDIMEQVSQLFFYASRY